MRACHGCGLSIGDTAAFCPVCGAPSLPGTTGPNSNPGTSQYVPCAICGHEGPYADVESCKLCQRCKSALDLLVDRQPHSGIAVGIGRTEEEAQRARAQTVDGVYSAIIDDDTCDACAAMDDRITTDLSEAERWTPNENCTNPEGCRCLVIWEMTSLTPDEVRAFLAYAAEHGLHVTAQAVHAFHEDVRKRQSETSRRVRAAYDRACEGRRCEKSDPQGAVAFYRQAIVEYLESCAAPLERQDVVGHLVFIFDRLSLVLKRSGERDEALEEIDSAASLGLLDRGTKSQREALTKRRSALRAASAKAPRS